MTHPDPIRTSWRSRLRAAWTRNDGLPRERRAGGRDLKHRVLIIVLTLTSAISIVGAVWLAVS